MLIKEIDELELDLKGDDVAYCIFDTDVDFNKNKIIEEAIQLANDNNIKVITSSPCFELWFLLHYEYTTAKMKNKDLISRLKTFYPRYDKNVDIYPNIIDSVAEAIKRAKKLEKYQIDNGRAIGTVEANPSTEIYKVVEYLLTK